MESGPVEKCSAGDRYLENFGRRPVASFSMHTSINVDHASACSPDVSLEKVVLVEAIGVASHLILGMDVVIHVLLLPLELLSLLG